MAQQSPAAAEHPHYHHPNEDKEWVDEKKDTAIENDFWSNNGFWNMQRLAHWEDFFMCQPHACSDPCKTPMPNMVKERGPNDADRKTAFDRNSLPQSQGVKKTEKVEASMGISAVKPASHRLSPRPLERRNSYKPNGDGVMI